MPAVAQGFDDEVVTAFWRQLEVTAADTLEEVLAEQGIVAAEEKLAELRAAGIRESLIREDELNGLGYKLMNAGNLDAAIFVFAANVETFPRSWNAHDSLGEAYRNAGDIEMAIESYTRSLELNPQNENGRQVLRRLEEGE